MDNLNLAGVFTSLSSKCDGCLALRSIVAAYDFYEELEEVLIMGDLGVEATYNILDDLKAKEYENQNCNRFCIKYDLFRWGCF
mgnify:CR=1 FL=1